MARIAFFAGSALLSLTVSFANAGITEVGGDAVIAEPPASILLNQWESNSEIRVWFERETILPQDINPAHSQPGFVNNASQLDIEQSSGVTISAGTHVQSYMIRIDPLRADAVTRNGYVTFDSQILGVYVGDQLDPTDSFLGRPGVQYNKNRLRGLDLESSPSTDNFEISSDLKRIDFTMAVGVRTDDIRVITAAAIPTPGPVAALGLAGLSIATRRRR